MEKTFDTNILIYSVDVLASRKHEIAKTIVARCFDESGFVALQCLAEFYRASTVKRLLSIAEAVAVVEATRDALQVVAASEADFVEAMSASERHGIQFFDALMLATVNRAGCRVFFSEDMQHERVYDGVRVVNPFRLEERALGEFLVDTA